MSARSDAAEVLGVSPGLTADLARNLVLHESPTLPAGQVYSGVLYEALDLASMDAAARRPVNRWIVVMSPLYGAVRLTDPIAPYRLSMGVNLPGRRPAGLAVAASALRGGCRRLWAAAWSSTAAPARMPAPGLPARGWLRGGSRSGA